MSEVKGLEKEKKRVKKNFNLLDRDVVGGVEGTIVAIGNLEHMSPTAGPRSPSSASGSRPSSALQRSSPSELEDERAESVSSLSPALYDGNEESRYKKK